MLHQRGSVKPWYLAWLAREHPELVGRYRRLYAGGAYVPAEYKEWLRARTAPLLRTHGFERRMERQSGGIPRPDEGAFPTGSLVGWGGSGVESFAGADALAPDAGQTTLF